MVPVAAMTRFRMAITRTTTSAATFITRACTLWFAVLVGLGALVLFARRTRISLGLPEREARSA